MRLQLVNEILPIPQQPSQAVNTNDHKRVALVQEIHQDGKLAPSVAAAGITERPLMEGAWSIVQT
ncbi:hypothetical protein ACIDI_5c00090 [Acidiphilium sp. JA12-A1]|nr:hypothetical protein ACIDI_5c00090 [Acidiphilium sp. JA12-A1]